MCGPFSSCSLEFVADVVCDFVRLVLVAGRQAVLAAKFAHLLSRQLGGHALAMVLLAVLRLPLSDFVRHCPLGSENGCPAVRTAGQLLLANRFDPFRQQAAGLRSEWTCRDVVRQRLGRPLCLGEHERLGKREAVDPHAAAPCPIAVTLLTPLATAGEVQKRAHSAMSFARFSNRSPR